MKNGQRTLGVLALVLLGASSPAAKADRVHVSKSSRTMEVFAGETLIASYRVAIGFGGPGPKTREGDGRTPVGIYHVKKHLPSHLRMFLELDYPNAADVARFNTALARGELPKGATIGGDVGIHGEPPWAKPFHKSTYSSHGCVVVEDQEIDQIARLVPDGAIVEIDP